MRRTVLIFTVDMIPGRNRHVSGGGLRVWGLGQGLKEKGHEVVYSMPKVSMEGEDCSGELLKYAFKPHQLSRIIRKVAPDVILFEQWGLATYLDETNIPVVIDLHGSLILENHYRRHQSFQSNVAAKIKSFAKADFLLCPSERQKNYFLPWLMLGGVPFDEKRIGVIPVSLSPNLPERREVLEPVFVFGGGLWPWVDPFPALDIVAEEIKAQEKGTLKIFSEKPHIQKVLPKDDVLGAYAAQVEKLETNNRVTLLGFVPHEDLIKEYAGASVAVDLYQWNRERELAFSTRTIEYLWCGLPVIHAGYSEISSHIQEYETGWCLDPNDMDGIRNTVSDILANGETVNGYAANAQKLIQDRFVWDKTIDPLNDFVISPFSKTGKRTFFDLISLEFDRIEEELEKENREKQDELIRKDHELNVLREVSQDALTELREELERRDAAITDLHFEMTVVNGKIQEHENTISRFSVENADLIALKNGLEEEVLHHQQEIRSFKEAVNERDEALGDLRKALHSASEHAGYLEGVLRSIQNRFLYKWYKRLAYGFKRLFLQYPRFLYLVMVNILTNVYMSRCCKRHKRKIFPAP